MNRVLPILMIFAFASAVYSAPCENVKTLALPNATIGNPGAGVIGSTIGNNRQVQLGLRLSF